MRYCARPPFALDRLRELDAKHLIYERAKPNPGGTGPLRLAPLELLDRLADLVPPPPLLRRARRKRLLTRNFGDGLDGLVVAGLRPS